MAPVSAPHPNGLPPVTSIPLTADDPAHAADGQSLGALVRDATTHLSTLIRAEVELARSEITAEVKQGVRGSLFFVVALTLALLLLPFLLTTVALVIAIWLPEWSGFAIVTGFMAVLAIVCALLGWRRVRKIKPPQRTIDSVRNTATALKRPSRDVAQYGDPGRP